MIRTSVELLSAFSIILIATGPVTVGCWLLSSRRV